MTSRARAPWGALLTIALVTGAMSSHANAHSFWVASDHYTTSKAAPTPIALTLQVGHNHEITPVVVTPDQILRFVAMDALGTRDIEPIAPSGRSPIVGRLAPSTSNPTVIGFEKKPTFLSLPGPKFQSYLAEEGLDAIVELRKEAGRSNYPGLEEYSRHAKLIVNAKSPRDGLGDNPLGLCCELLAEPSAPSSNALTVRLVLRGEPVVGARVTLAPLLERDVVAHDASDICPDRAVQQQQTDADGRVEFRSPTGGRFVLSSVHMERVNGGSKADWRSYWPSLVFEVPTPNAEPAPSGNSANVAPENSTPTGS